MVNGYQLSHTKVWEADVALFIPCYCSFGSMYTFFLDAYPLLMKKVGWCGRIVSKWSENRYSHIGHNTFVHHCLITVFMVTMSSAYISSMHK